MSFALGGFLTGSRTDKFETDASPDPVIIRSRTILFLRVGVQRLKI